MELIAQCQHDGVLLDVAYLLEAVDAHEGHDALGAQAQKHQQCHTVLPPVRKPLPQERPVLRGFLLKSPVQLPPLLLRRLPASLLNRLAQLHEQPGNGGLAEILC